MWVVWLAITPLAFGPLVEFGRSGGKFTFILGGAAFLALFAAPFIITVWMDE